MDLLIFDLDGTLIDSKLDLALSVNATRAHMGMPPLDVERVSTYVGHGAPILVRRALGEQATDAEFEKALQFFLQYYREHELDHTKLYPGVRVSLDRLHGAGKRLAVLTNKPVAMSRAIVEGLGVGARFFQVCGGDSFRFKKPHPIGVESLMAAAGVTHANTLMVGDSSIDIETARSAGVSSCGVTYGFAPQTLLEPAPDLLVDRIEELADWVLDCTRERR